MSNLYDSTSLYDLPKDILVKLIATIQEETIKDYINKNKYVIKISKEVYDSETMYSRNKLMYIKGPYKTLDECYRIIKILICESGYSKEIHHKSWDYFVDDIEDGPSYGYYSYTISVLEK